MPPDNFANAMAKWHEHLPNWLEIAPQSGDGHSAVIYRVVR